LRFWANPQPNTSCGAGKHNKLNRASNETICHRKAPTHAKFHVWCNEVAISLQYDVASLLFGPQYVERFRFVPRGNDPIRNLQRVQLASSYRYGRRVTQSANDTPRFSGSLLCRRQQYHSLLQSRRTSKVDLRCEHASICTSTPHNEHGNHKSTNSIPKLYERCSYRRELPCPNFISKFFLGGKWNSHRCARRAYMFEGRSTRQVYQHKYENINES